MTNLTCSVINTQIDDLLKKGNNNMHTTELYFSCWGMLHVLTIYILITVWYLFTPSSLSLFLFEHLDALYIFYWKIRLITDKKFHRLWLHLFCSVTILSSCWWQENIEKEYRAALLPSMIHYDMLCFHWQCITSFSNQGKIFHSHFLPFSNEYNLCLAN